MGKKYNDIWNIKHYILTLNFAHNTYKQTMKEISPSINTPRIYRTYKKTLSLAKREFLVIS
jgi:hypothetical protein